jgi:hypothetical protein
MTSFIEAIRREAVDTVFRKSIGTRMRVDEADRRSLYQHQHQNRKEFCDRIACERVRETFLAIRFWKTIPLSLFSLSAPNRLLPVTMQMRNGSALIRTDLFKLLHPHDEHISGLDVLYREKRRKQCCNRDT